MPYTINDGLRIHYTYEVTGSGEPLVLYHGLTGSGERWRIQSSSLASLGVKYTKAVYRTLKIAIAICNTRIITTV